jgi:hypothetical protein
MVKWKKEVLVKIGLMSRPVTKTNKSKKKKERKEKRRQVHDGCARPHTCGDVFTQKKKNRRAELFFLKKGETDEHKNKGKHERLPFLVHAGNSAVNFFKVPFPSNEKKKREIVSENVSPTR